jgi:glutathione synthase/RimK-type ligase-like ATP-grasp enzyme
VRWQDFEAVVIRSTWDYHRRYDDFLRWLDRMEGINLFNPVQVVRWNANKTYLRDLAAGGIAVVPTLWPTRHTEIPILMRENGWRQAVLKPTISATAYQTHLITSEDQLAPFSGEMMLQPFMPEIAENGEWSLIFFHGRFSHAVLKRPKAGDFRVQHDFGGTIEALLPPPSLIEQAVTAVAKVNSPLLYARVDGIDVDGKLYLMELELIEPDLFLNPETAARFVDTLLQFVP